ncbi:MAG: hypothetical protein KatS3mg027_1978 [Bacteroidia bacterium]|nr:MAG: hypothetical protein KatS3mg027_1978 [Bacteroidia bacterium]
MDTADFYKVFKHLEGIPNVDRRIVLMEQFIKHNCFNPTQAQNLLELVPFEVERLKIAKQLLPKLNNVFELENWNFLFKKQCRTTNIFRTLSKLSFLIYLIIPTLPDSVLNNFITQIKKLTK